jgi:ABC-type phosphate transport system substrate-binding protein
MTRHAAPDRRQLLRVLLAFVLGSTALSALPSPTSAGDVDEGVVVLLNARNPTQNLTPAELTKLFLGQTAFWHGVVPVRVVLRPDGSIAAKTFYETVLKMTPQAFRKHWDEAQLSGRGVAPKALGTPEEVAQIIAQAPGAVGYALASEAWKLNNKGVKVIQVR